MVLKSSIAGLVALVALAGLHEVRAQPGGRGRGGPRPLMFGFALECTDCSRSPGDLGTPVWHYTSYPRVVTVAPNGAAEQAGVREGDVVQAIDGLSLLSPDGARRFSAVQIGDKIILTVERGGRTLDLKLALKLGKLVDKMAANGFGRGRAERAGVDGLGPPPADAPRYTGRVGGAMVDVWSDTPVIAFIDSSGATVLRIGTTTVRLNATRFGPTGRRGGLPPAP